MQFEVTAKHFKLAAILIPIVVGVGLLITDALEYQEGLDSVNWIPANGKMLSNVIKSERPGYGKMIYIPRVAYSYHIKDDAYRGDRMTFPDQIPSPEKDLKKLLERVEVGHPVESFYDPKNITRVTLVRGVRKSKYCLVFLRDVALIALPLIVAGIVFLLRKKKTQQA